MPASLSADDGSTTFSSLPVARSPRSIDPGSWPFSHPMRAQADDAAAQSPAGGLSGLRRGPAQRRRHLARGAGTRVIRATRRRWACTGAGRSERGTSTEDDRMAGGAKTEDGRRSWHGSHGRSARGIAHRSRRVRNAGRVSCARRCAIETSLVRRFGRSHAERHPSATRASDQEGAACGLEHAPNARHGGPRRWRSRAIRISWCSGRRRVCGSRRERSTGSSGLHSAVRRRWSRPRV